MKNQSRHPDTGSVVGGKDVPRNPGGSTDVGYSYSKSMPGCGKEHLQQDATYTEEKITSDTRPDRIDRGARRPSDRI